MKKLQNEKNINTNVGIMTLDQHRCYSWPSQRRGPGRSAPAGSGSELCALRALSQLEPCVLPAALAKLEAFSDTAA